VEPMLGGGSSAPVTGFAVEPVDLPQGDTRPTNQDARQVLDWLKTTALLYNVPFNNLVAHPALLPQESIRFFYIDQNWIDALLDGALSIGVQTSRDADFQSIMRDKLFQNVRDDIAVVRDALLGIPPGSPSTIVQMAGFLLRSQCVTNWPGLEISAWAASDPANPMKPLRLDRLADDTLFAIYPEIPIRLTFTEPGEGLVFGVEDEGVEMRYFPGVSGFTPENMGKVIETNGSRPCLPFQSILTSGPNLAIRMNRAGSAGLVQLMEGILPGKPQLTPASFAVQMARVPEQLLLTLSDRPQETNP
jgi:hypothetical protein